MAQFDKGCHPVPFIPLYRCNKSDSAKESYMQCGITKTIVGANLLQENRIIPLKRRCAEQHIFNIPTDLMSHSPLATLTPCTSLNMTPLLLGLLFQTQFSLSARQRHQALRAKLCEDETDQRTFRRNEKEEHFRAQRNRLVIDKHRFPSISINNGRRAPCNRLKTSIAIWYIQRHGE